MCTLVPLVFLFCVTSASAHISLIVALALPAVPLLALSTRVELILAVICALVYLLVLGPCASAHIPSVVASVAVFST